MTSKIKPIDRSYKSSYNAHDQDKEDRHRKKKKDAGGSGPAVVNHIISEKAQVHMKQLQLPFDDDLDLDLKVFELYLYRDPRAGYKSYGTHVEFTLAKNINQAEELFSNTYPTWWRTMGVKETTPEEVARKLDLLKEQVTTCKFVLEALNISQ